jgi:protease IV
MDMETPPLPPNAVPPPLTPPPVIAPPPPAKSRRGRGWMITTIILSVLLVFCVLIIFTQLLSRVLNSGLSSGLRSGFRTTTTRDVGPRLDECMIEDNGARRKIAVVTVDGLITSHTSDQAGNNMVDVIKAQLDRAKDDDRVRAVILKVDSPGGEVMASDEINRVIAKFQADSGKPVVCSMGSLAASGGYYISVPCRWIVADELTLTGSIGVIMESLNYRGLMDKVGLEPVVYKSGKYKDMLSGMRSTNEIPPGEHAMVQKLIDDTYQKFKSVVADGRKAAHDTNKTEGRALVSNWTDYADGRVLSGADALGYGFVDELGDFDKAVERTKKIARLSNANLIEYRERYDFGDFLHMFGQSESSRAIRIDLGAELPKLEAGYLYFLSPTYVN